MSFWLGMDSPAASKISEAQLQDAIAECAQRLGWIVFHARPARTLTGWRTPVAYDGKGYPDLTMIHPRQQRLIFAEIKAERGRLRAEQQRWINDLLDAGASAYVWTPTAWLDGSVDRILRGEEVA